ncbi:MAG: NUDIX domain-containing protein [Steroidobacteraceae bacterium]
MKQALAQPIILDRHTTYQGYLTVNVLTVKLADGAVVSREVEEHGDVAAVLPYDPQRRCALIVRLFRAPVFAITSEDTLEEACAGMVDPKDKDIGATARREAFEELGVKLSTLDSIARVWSTPGVSTERISLFIAPYAFQDRTGAGGGVPGEHERITVIERPLMELSAAADDGRIVDSKLLMLVMALRNRQSDLFVNQ